MNRNQLFRRGRWAIPGAAIAVGIVGGGAFAALTPGPVKNYTGCLTSGPGLVALVAEGDTPVRPCPIGTKEIHLGGGDITAVSVGAGLTGGGENGAASIGVDPTFALPQNCADDKIPKWNAGATAWQCATDNTTRYTAGAGLSLSESSPPFEAHVFSIDQGHRLPQGCAGGAVPIKAGSGTGWTCSTGGGAGAASHAYVARGGAEYSHSFLQIPVASLTLPAGSYVIQGKGGIINADADEQIAECRLSTGDFSKTWVHEGGDINMQAIPLLDAATFDSETIVTLSCGTWDGHVFGTLTAIPVGGIN